MLKFLVLFSMVFLAAESSSSSAVKNLKQYFPWDKIEAENYSASYGAQTYVSACGIHGLGYTANDAWAGYNEVDFEDGAELVTFNLRGSNTDYRTGSIFIRLGSNTAEPVANITVSNTMGDDCSYINITTFLPTVISGVQDLYLTFYSPTENHIVDIDWFLFTKKYVHV